MKMIKAIEGYEYSKISEGYSRDTIDRYHYCLVQFSNYLGNPDIALIKSDDLKQFIYWLRVEYIPKRPSGNTEPLSNASLYSSWKAIKSFYNWAEIELKIKRPDTNFKAPKYTSKVIEPYSETDIVSILKACEFNKIIHPRNRKKYQILRPTAKRDKAIVLLLLDTGLRVSECGRLKIKDIDLENGELYISPFGSGYKTKSRQVYLGKAARSAVWLFLAERDIKREDEPLFLTRNCKSMNRHNIRALMRRLGERSGVRGVHPHRFRHTFAIQFLRNGGDVFSLQRLLGHSSLDMVKNYLAIAVNDVKNAHITSSPVDRWNL